MKLVFRPKVPHRPQESHEHHRPKPAQEPEKRTAQKDWLLLCAAKFSKKFSKSPKKIRTLVDIGLTKMDYGTASYYGVFDGHNGVDAAAYSSCHVHQYLVESPHYPHDPERALKDAFKKTDDRFIDKCNKEKRVA
ncbi:unnamed protein product [Nesidiocoris tenuis]|uniref:PPM-type phosphatase domain-containing protein n=1 Tax=Nesidiocoris tenuis TaxID=355587 RepID=A0A6H5HDR0_9HEMI|nr:unnamed protein product [Nesidiocoris tenuis]